jgi:hypothetical protein
VPADTVKQGRHALGVHQPTGFHGLNDGVQLFLGRRLENPLHTFSLAPGHRVTGEHLPLRPLRTQAVPRTLCSIVSWSSTRKRSSPSTRRGGGSCRDSYARSSRRICAVGGWNMASYGPSAQAADTSTGRRSAVNAAAGARLVHRGAWPRLGCNWWTTCCPVRRIAMVTFIQRFSSKLDLNVHLHNLALDRVYTFEYGKAPFHHASAQPACTHFPGWPRSPQSTPSACAGDWPRR